MPIYLLTLREHSSDLAGLALEDVEPSEASVIVEAVESREERTE